MNRRPLTLTAGQLRRLREQLHRSHDTRVYRRALAILEVARGRPAGGVADLLGVSRRTIYYWIDAYARRHDAAELLPEQRPGRPSLWTQAARALIAELLGDSPMDRDCFAANWTAALLQEQLRQATGREFSDETVRRELHRQGYVWKRPRYALEPDPQREKKTANLRAGPSSVTP